MEKELYNNLSEGLDCIQDYYFDSNSTFRPNKEGGTNGSVGKPTTGAASIQALPEAEREPNCQTEQNASPSKDKHIAIVSEFYKQLKCTHQGGFPFTAAVMEEKNRKSKERKRQTNRNFASRKRKQAKDQIESYTRQYRDLAEGNEALRNRQQALQRELFEQQQLSIFLRKQQRNMENAMGPKTTSTAMNDNLQHAIRSTNQRGTELQALLQSFNSQPQQFQPEQESQLQPEHYYPRSRQQSQHQCNQGQAELQEFFQSYGSQLQQREPQTKTCHPQSWAPNQERGAGGNHGNC